MAQIPDLVSISRMVVVQSLLGERDYDLPGRDLQSYFIALLGTGAFSAVSQSILENIVHEQPDKLTNEILVNVCPVHLRNLDLTSCTKLSGKGIAKTLDKCSKIHSLDMRNIELPTHNSFFTLFRCMKIRSQQLHSFSLEGVENLTDSHVQCLLRYLPQLKQLNVSSCNLLTDRAFLIDEELQLSREARAKAGGAMQWASSLSSVDVSGCSGLTSTSIRHLTALCGPTLQHINISYTNIDSTALWYLSGYSLMSAIHMVHALAKTRGHHFISNDEGTDKALDDLMKTTEQVSRLLQKQQENTAQQDEESCAEASGDPQNHYADSISGEKCDEIPTNKLTEILKESDVAETLVSALNKYEDRPFWETLRLLKHSGSNPLSSKESNQNDENLQDSESESVTSVRSDHATGGILDLEIEKKKSQGILENFATEKVVEVSVGSEGDDSSIPDPFMVVETKDGLIVPVDSFKGDEVSSQCESSTSDSKGMLNLEVEEAYGMSEEELEGAVGGFEPPTCDYEAAFGGEYTESGQFYVGQKEYQLCEDIETGDFAADDLIIDVMAMSNHPEITEKTESQEITPDDIIIDAIAFSNLPEQGVIPEAEELFSEDDLVIDAIAFSNQPQMTLIDEIYHQPYNSLDSDFGSSFSGDLNQSTDILGEIQDPIEMCEGTSEFLPLNDRLGSREKTFDRLAKLSITQNTATSVHAEGPSARDVVFSKLRKKRSFCGVNERGDYSRSSEQESEDTQYMFPKPDSRGESVVEMKAGDGVTLRCNTSVEHQQIMCESQQTVLESSPVDKGQELDEENQSDVSPGQHAVLEIKSCVSEGQECQTGVNESQQFVFESQSEVSEGQGFVLESGSDVSEGEQSVHGSQSEVCEGWTLILESHSEDQHSVHDSKPIVNDNQQSVLEDMPKVSEIQHYELESQSDKQVNEMAVQNHLAEPATLCGSDNVDAYSVQDNKCADSCSDSVISSSIKHRPVLNTDKLTCDTNLSGESAQGDSKAESKIQDQSIASCEISMQPCDTNPAVECQHASDFMSSGSEVKTSQVPDQNSGAANFGVLGEMCVSVDADSNFGFKSDTPYYKWDSMKMVSHRKEFDFDIEAMKKEYQANDDSSSSDDDVILSVPQDKFTQDGVDSGDNEGQVDTYHCDVNDNKLQKDEQKEDGCSNSPQEPTCDATATEETANSIPLQQESKPTEYSKTSNTGPITEPCLDRIQLFTPGLTSIDLSSVVCHSKELVETCVKALFLTNPNIQNLAMSWKELDDALLRFIADHAPHLAKISLLDCEGLSSMGVAYLCQKCPRLTSLNLRGVYFISDFALAPLMDGRELTHLNLAETNITDVSLNAIANKCPQLTELDLSWCEEIMEEGTDAMETLIQSGSALQVFKLRHLPMSDHCLFSLAAHCVNLTRLNVSNVNMADSHLLSISLRCKQIRNLDVSWNSALTDLGCSSVLSHLIHLQILDMSGIKQLSSQPLLPIISDLPRWRKCQALFKFKQGERKVLSELDEEPETSDEEYDCLYLPCRSTVFAPCLRALELQYSDKINDEHLAEIVAVCRGTLKIKDYYGDWVTPMLLQGHH